MKTKGISAIELALSTASKDTVSARGKDKFVVMDIAHYHYLCECDLDAALAETRADIAADDPQLRQAGVAGKPPQHA